MKAAEIRRSFLDFFAQRGHTVLPSSSLVPEGDPTLFFTNAGMVQFKDVFTGVEKRPYTRATTVQKCMRVSGKHNDLENVGFTARHHTLFEMLGNFSFGDYFKADAIPFAWEFLTKNMGLPADRLLVTVFREDDESADLWRKVGVPGERIGRCGEKDNFWSMGPIGPCGPCTEIHWDLGSDFVPDNEPDAWGFGHDAGRYMELWNNVFMQFERYEEGGSIRQRNLPRPSVDTGMGLERLAAVTQGRNSNWEIDELQRIIAHAGRIAGLAYGAEPGKDTSLRVIADHSRAAAFLVGDGVTPSTEGRGYVLRRIMRRAIRHGVKLGIERPFLHETAGTVIDLMKASYPELENRRAVIARVVLNEEKTFRETLGRGLTLLDDAFAEAASEGSRVLPGRTVFVLHDTFGFPPDLTQVIAGERGFGADMEGYEAAMEEQRERSRASWKGSGEQAGSAVYRGLGGDVCTLFTGYGETRGEGRVLQILVDGRPVDAAEAGARVEVVTDTTPFYAESGGQVGDAGTMTASDVRVRVEDCVKPAAGLSLHRGSVEAGALRVGQAVTLEVDAVRRRDIMRNHTATHLLHAALRRVLGTHVQQKGSLVEAGRLRFDFSHFEAIPGQAARDIEDLVNGQVLEDVRLQTREMPMAEAQKLGAMALFGEKYGDVVRVVEVPGFSVELCGGTHCGSTGQIGLLKLTSEGGIAAGVRRVEAVTGRGAFSWLRDLESTQSAVNERLRSRGAETVDRLQKLLDDRKALQKEVEDLKRKLVTSGAGGVAGAGGGPSSAGGGGGLQPREIGGVKVLATLLDAASGKELRSHGDALLEKLGQGIVVLGARDGDKASLLVKVSKELTGRVPAGDLVRHLAAVVGGSGGGRPDMAQAGGKEPEKLPEAIERAWTLIGEALG
jgi:alanyl-tRNA synthetase